MKVFIALILLVFSLPSFAQKAKDCKIMKAGTFKYVGIEDTTAVVVIDSVKHIEFHQSSTYHIESDLKWINDCTFELTMTEITIPNFPFGPGTKMKVVIQKVKDDRIFFRATVNGKSWEGQFQKLL
jgi:hypothetical protein